MPLADIRCCGEDWPVDDYVAGHLAHSTCQWTPPVGRAVLDAVRAHPSNRDPRYLSVSTLVASCLRAKYLERTVPYRASMRDLWASFMGTELHRTLAEHAGPGTLAEARFSTRVDGHELSGAPDLIDLERGVLLDYKRVRRVPPRPRAEHVAQLQVYRWLVDHADQVAVGGEVFTEDLDRFRCTSWTRLAVVYIHSSDGPVVMDVGPVWPDGRVEGLVREGVRRWVQAWEGTVPDAAWPDQSHPLCEYCHVRTECRTIETARKDA